MSVTTIQGSISLALGTGSVVTSIVVSNPSFTDQFSVFHPSGSSTVTIPSSGSYSFTLAPTAGSTPSGVVYTATYYIANATTFTETWVVPVSATPLTIQQIRFNPTVPAPPFLVQANQLYSATANIGDVLVFNGATYTPVTIQSVYPFSFSSVSTVTIPAATHEQGTALILQVYDSNGNELDPTVNVLPVTGDATITFGTATTGFGFLYGGLGASLPNFSKHFSNLQAVTVKQSQHRFNTANLSISLYDDSGNLIDAQAQVQVTPTYDVNVTFASPTTFRVVIAGCLGTTPSSGGSSQTGMLPAPYLQTVTAQTSVSILASAHGKGQYALAHAFTNDTPSIAAVPNYTRDASGNLVFTFSPAFSGTLQII